MLTTHLTLLERLRNPRDEQAWIRFADLYTPLLLRWALQLRLQSADAADLVQDVMVLLSRKLPGNAYTHTGSFRAWLKTVFRNKLRERLRRRQPATCDESPALETLAAPEDDSAEEEDRRLLLQRGLALIRPEFSDVTWQAFWQYAMCERAPAEVAQELNISTGTVYAAKSRVLQRLRLDLQLFLD